MRRLALVNLDYDKYMYVVKLCEPQVTEIHLKYDIRF